MEAVKLKPAGLYKDENGKLFRKLQMSEAAAAENPVKGETTYGKGENAKTIPAFFEEVKVGQ